MGREKISREQEEKGKRSREVLPLARHRPRIAFHFLLSRLSRNCLSSNLDTRRSVFSISLVGEGVGNARALVSPLALEQLPIEPR